MSDFKLTYSTMFAPPPELHQRFDAALAAVRQHRLGQTHGLFLDGAFVPRAATIERHNPARLSELLGRFALASVDDVDQAVAAARRAWPAWRATPWPERVALLRRAARLVDERLYEMAAIVSLEVGKTRMEALGEVAEVSAFFDIYAQQMQDHAGFDHALPNDPLPHLVSRNRSVMKPYGVWAVIAPFNYPFALAGGPTAAALITGNTVVLKGSVETPWSGLLLAQCLKDAGLPDGVFNALVGDGGTVGEALMRHDGIGGITFTGSYEVGMRIYRAQAQRAWPRPCIAEMGGKNAAIVTARADLDVAAQGIVRSAFGMSGQKCSALSRVYVDRTVADALIERLQTAVQALAVGEPQLQTSWTGPVATAAAAARHAACVRELSGPGARIVARGPLPADATQGHYCAPVVAEAPLDHPLWRREMFAPLVMIGRVDHAEQAMAEANASPFGLTAGFFGAEDEVAWFLDHIEAGVTYVNRPLGATTGAWPGYQPFGGWKGSGSTGKALASFHYLPQYMREQSQTRIGG
ncbi:aldehyde dehydrogenase family protein [Hydrogenophaga sp. T2]|uniref:aldehyde dehydrogenase family protein n=1 Tax=Hydrogenophaga sp. T2 TaxID=3132823 RepID=UPI003CF4F441